MILLWSWKKNSWQNFNLWLLYSISHCKLAFMLKFLDAFHSPRWVVVWNLVAQADKIQNVVFSWLVIILLDLLYKLTLQITSIVLAYIGNRVIRISDCYWLLLIRAPCQKMFEEKDRLGLWPATNPWAQRAIQSTWNHDGLAKHTTVTSHMSG